MLTFLKLLLAYLVLVMLTCLLMSMIDGPEAVIEPDDEDLDDDDEWDDPGARATVRKGPGVA